jgi:hypothetical protein
VSLLNSFSKVIEKEKELDKITVDGDNLLNYYNEDSDRKKSIIRKYHKLRDDIANDEDIPIYYKDSMLGTLDKYIRKIDPNHEENKSNNLLYGAIGALVGSLGTYGIEKFLNDFENDIAQKVISEIYKNNR